MSRQVQTLAPSGLVRYTVYSESRKDCWECGESTSPFQSTVTCHLSQAQVGDRLSSWNLPQEPRDGGGILALPLDHLLAASSRFSKARRARNYSLASAYEAHRLSRDPSPTGGQDSQKALSSSEADSPAHRLVSSKLSDTLIHSLWQSAVCRSRAYQVGNIELTKLHCMNSTHLNCVIKTAIYSRESS